MDCKLAQQKIALLAYGELPDDQYHILESHLGTCNRCQEELTAIQALQQAMAFAPSEEPSANLLAQARLRLEEALDNMPRASWLTRVQQSMFRGVGILARSPLAASALLILGLGSGALGGYRYATHTRSPLPSLDGPAKIASVSSIVREPNSENVEVHFNRLVPETTQGSLDDPQIRQLLLVGAESQLNPVIAQKSVSLLADECEAGHQCSDGPIRHALLVALRYDKDTGVRLKALDGLKPYVAEDMRVRDAVLEALMDDSDPSVRSEAIELLKPVEADSSVREVLHTVASEDDNPHIRTVSQEFLDRPLRIQ